VEDVERGKKNPILEPRRILGPQGNEGTDGIGLGHFTTERERGTQRPEDTEQGRASHAQKDGNRYSGGECLKGKREGKGMEGIRRVKKDSPAGGWRLRVALRYQGVTPKESTCVWGRGELRLQE